VTVANLLNINFIFQEAQFLVQVLKIMELLLFRDWHFTSKIINLMRVSMLFAKGLRAATEANHLIVAGTEGGRFLAVVALL